MSNLQKCKHFLNINDCSECSGRKVESVEMYRTSWIEKKTGERKFGKGYRKVVSFSQRKVERLSKELNIKCTGC